MSQNQAIQKYYLKPTEGQRLYPIDLLRFLSMIAIAHFHCFEAFFYENIRPVNYNNSFESQLENYSRFMAFSGFTIVILSYFLIGFKGVSLRKIQKLILISLFGFIILYFIYGGQNFYLFEWDIYAFILASSGMLYLLSKIKFLLRVVSYSFIPILLLPASAFDWPQWQNSFWYNPLVGNYYQIGQGGWPLLPWIGLPLLFFTLGQTIRENENFLLFLTKIKPFEIFVWLLLVGLAIPQLGSFHHVPIGPGFAKFVNTLPRLDQWSHLLFVILIMRLSFVPPINNQLGNLSLVRWISNLYLNRKFFLFYLVSWLIIGLMSEFSDQLRQNPQLFTLALLILFPLTELSCHLLILGSKRVKNLRLTNSYS